MSIAVTAQFRAPAADARVDVKGSTLTTVNVPGTQSARERAAESSRAVPHFGNNVPAHAPEVNDPVGGVQPLLKPISERVLRLS